MAEHTETLAVHAGRVIDPRYRSARTSHSSQYDLRARRGRKLSARFHLCDI